MTDQPIPLHPPSSTAQQVQWLTISEDQAGQRVDNFLMARLKGVPKARVYNILRKGEVRVNKGRIKPDYRLQPGDLVRIPPVRVAQRTPPGKPSDQLLRLLENSILFENEGLLVINKPPGLAVHGGSGVSLGLIEALRLMRPEASYLELVHRLDRDTSGCIMVAKKRSTLRHLQAALRNKGVSGVRKVYQALVLGQWPARRHRVDVPLLKLELNSGKERIVKVHPEGKPSLTEFRVLRAYGDCTLVEARPITGRTHQIRVHAQYAGHSLAGDEKYGDDDANDRLRKVGVKRLFLHATELGFYLPGESELTVVSASLSDDLAAALVKLS
ncbi:23S rRNA pseudouridine(955/2504/2580) synthase RluC [Marinimicrobium sp. ABcell2]|uniref:23S rRNA pseudouridine(955/2504/2580) synthase RluC n=1 Tax=Marinimicrobium sp. ABcell2 TaxID=3069751 RepID=UPI0027B13DCC|nr:23S rRNA pseudouridine(955/2504/2580) synthase RluC [Marinimicrobium sp. ABcell2]MDQ2075668.1 23S rRNA pseudouridine(955/2504/2580) synthase RluC [Marinimicrobium sp. ABcell2]